MILVTGATGNIGRDLIQLLLDKGQSVRALTRDPKRAGLPAGVDVRAADLSNPGSLSGLFDGVDKAFLLVHIPGEPAQAGNFLRGAKAGGVRHVVLLSSMSTERVIPGDAVGGGHRELEREVLASGIPATILRPGTFDSNVLMWADQVRTQNVVRGMSFAPAAPIDPQDIAAVAAVVLTQPGHEGKTYALTGPERIGAEEQLRVIGEVLGKRLRFEPLPMEVLREFVRKSSEGHGDPDATIRAVSSPEVPWANPRPTVRELIGREPRTFRQWAQAHAGAFR
jgi:uncharacterized protein YbjT (DUF2867 family)